MFAHRFLLNRFKVATAKEERINNLKEQQGTFCLHTQIFFSSEFCFYFKQIFYVRAPQQLTPSGVGTIKLTYTPNQSQPQSIIQYAATQPKVWI